MSDENKNEEITNVPNKIKFDFDQAKTTTQQSLEMEDAAASGQELDEESPTQHKFVRFRGKSWEDLLKVHGVKLSGPDGEDIKYVVQVQDPTTFTKVNMMCDYKVKEYVIAPYVSDTGVERIWFVNFKWAGKASKKGLSVRKAIELGQQEWVKINWEGKRGFVTRPPGLGLSKEPEFSKMTNKEIIELIFEDRIITDAKHDAVVGNWG